MFGAAIERIKGGEMRIAVTGDAIISRPLSPFTDDDSLAVAQVLRDADAAITNAEILFHDFEDSPTGVPGGTYMRARPALIRELAWMGIDAVATANNHAYDFGEGGVMTNLANLDSYGMPHAGTGATLAEATAPTYVDTKEGRVALISATTSAPPGSIAQDQWRDGRGRPGANVIRYSSTYNVPREIFDAVRVFRDKLGLIGWAKLTADGTRDHTDRTMAFHDLSLGMAAQPDTATDFYMSDLQHPWQYPSPNGCRIRLSDEYSRELTFHAVDVDRNMQRVADARRQADYVVFSVHNQEHGRTADDASSAMVELAHAAVDAGADIVHGHGPHRDRGIELYRGRPIFYALGHLVMQNNTIDRVPLDNMIRSGVANAWEATPADFFDSRAGAERDGKRKGDAVNPAIWRDVIATTVFHGSTLQSIELHPIDLGLDLPRSQRGRPTRASGESAAAVLELFRELSDRLGTRVLVDKGVGRIEIR